MKRRQQTLAKFDASHLYPSNADAAASAVMYIEKSAKVPEDPLALSKGSGFNGCVNVKSKSFDML